MKKVASIFRIIVITVCFCAIGMLTGCDNEKLAECFQKEVVEQKATEVIINMSEGRFDAVSAMICADLQKKLTPEVLKEAMEQLCGEAGSFKEIESMAFLGQKIENQDAAIAVAIVIYEDLRVRFTITFNPDMEITGLYMK